MTQKSTVFLLKGLRTFPKKDKATRNGGFYFAILVQWTTLQI
jgi:hypothetical protein